MAGSAYRAPSKVPTPSRVAPSVGNRTEESFVRDDRRGLNLYEGPDGDLVPGRMRDVSESLDAPSPDDP